MGNSLAEARKRIKQLETELKATNGVSSIYYVERAFSHILKSGRKVTRDIQLPILSGRTARNRALKIKARKFLVLMPV